jgi:hypothetical protein
MAGQRERFAVRNINSHTCRYKVVAPGREAGVANRVRVGISNQRVTIQRFYDPVILVPPDPDLNAGAVGLLEGEEISPHGLSERGCAE